MKKFLLFATALTLLAACSHNGNDEPEKIDRTVLVYIAGDNNLSEYIMSDLQEIMRGTKELAATNNKLILFVDNASEKPYFLQVEQGDTIRLNTMETEMKTSDPSTLYTAMKYITDNYAADSYGLVLWGHADGWIMHENAQPASSARSQSHGGPRRAYGVDYVGGRMWMNIPDMAKALGRLPRLKFIFADCCCFMCVEDVYELRNCADYIIGSAAEIPGVGAPYHTVVPAMFSQDSTFYEQIVSRYYEQKAGGYNVPLAAVKTSELDDLAKATAETLKSFAADIPPYDDGCRYPDMDGLIFYYDHTQYDMQDFMLHYASEEQYAEWKRVFDRAVPVRTYAAVWMANHVIYSGDDAFSEFTPTKERQGGLGMFVPQKDSDADRWHWMYRANLGVTMNYLNNAVKSMQWYKAAQLEALGW